MPNYDFRCQQCSQKFSRRVSIAEKDKVTCPKCEGKAEQIFTGFLYSKPGGESAGSSGCSSSNCRGCSGC
ncbi:zinc ribbon domain-containing protein [Metallumcola ferriviriculae]|uniref:Zinc ribbon domain-containing protein n=1 Tax=Metallumcola ferriviriculae TaxID=3039180 RepID=A0AAU0UJ13_9FIRM|nr:zinc ribbon domain-containing protein [Desulfitibacteraceae bacterium MK1]